MKASLEERMRENKVKVTREEIPEVAATLGYSESVRVRGNPERKAHIFISILQQIIKIRITRSKKL